jgi:chromosome segregation and condensation protein ScpB
MSLERKLPVVEALLLLNPDGYTEEELSRMFRLDAKTLEELLRQLQEKYTDGVVIAKRGKRWIMTVNPEIIPEVRKYFRQVELTRAELKILGIIAKQPGVEKRALVKKFGSHVYSIVKSLREKGFIREARKERKVLLFPTEKFSEYFG